MTDRPLDQYYATRSAKDQREAYDAWATSYERDLCAMGYRIPAVIAALFARYVPADTGPILDAGCGGGIQSEALAHLGYGPITGIDLSPGMLHVARAKGVYADLKEQTLGERLDFPDNHFGAVITAGTITPGHAPARTFDELIRVARPGARILFSLRSDAEQLPEYPAALARLTKAGAWAHLFSTEGFHSMPYGAPDVIHQVHVYEVNP